MKKAFNRWLSLLLCLTLLLTSGILTAIPAASAAEAPSLVSVYAEDDYESYTADAALPSGEGTIYSKAVGTVVNAGGSHGKALHVQIKDGWDYFTVPVSVTDKELTFDLCFEAGTVHNAVSGVFARIYGNGSQNLYTIFGNETVHVNDSVKHGLKNSADYGNEGNGIPGTVYGDAITYTDGVWYKVKMHQEGQTLSTKVWAEGTEEPSGWNAVSTTSMPMTGENPVVQLCFVANGYQQNVMIDNLRIGKIPSAETGNVYAEDDYESHTADAALPSGEGTIYSKAVGTVVNAGGSHGQALRVQLGSSWDYLTVPTGVIDKELTFDLCFEAGTSHTATSGVYARIHSIGGSNNLYTIFSGGVANGLRNTADYADEGNGIPNTVYTGTASYTDGTWYKVKMHQEGQKLSTKIWAEGSEEPSTWNAVSTTTIPMTAEGAVTQLCFVSNGAQQNVLVDNLRIAPLPQEEVYAKDDYESYTADAALPSGEDTIYSKAVGTVVNAGGSHGQALRVQLGSSWDYLTVPTGVIDKELTFDLCFEAGTSHTATSGVYARIHSIGGSNNLYTIFSGGVANGLRNTADYADEGNGIPNTVYTGTASYTDGTWYKVKMHQEGQKLSTKIWAEGSEEPSTWNAVSTTTIPMTAEGAVTQLCFVSNGAQQNVLVDNLRIAPLPQEEVYAKDDYESYTADAALPSGEDTIYSKAVGTVVNAGGSHGQALRVQLGSSWDYLTVPTGVIDKELTFDLCFEAGTSHTATSGVYARIHSIGGSNNLYTIFSGGVANGLRNTADYADEGNGIPNTVYTGTASYTDGTWYKVKMHQEGQKLSTKIWAEGTKEPDAWNAVSTTTIPMTAEGAVTQLCFVSNGAQQNVLIDNLRIAPLPEVEEEEPEDLGPAIPDDLYNGWSDAVNAESDLSQYQVPGSAVSIVEDGDRQAIKIDTQGAVNSDYFRIPASQQEKLVSFDFKFNPAVLSSHAGLYMRAYESDGQIDAIFSNGTVSGLRPGVTLKSSDNFGWSDEALANKWYSAKYMWKDGILSVKVWEAGTEEPAAWSVYGEAPNAPAAKSNDIQMYLVTMNVDTDFYFDNLKVQYFEDPTNYYTVTAEVNDDQLGTASASGTTNSEGKFAAGAKVTLTAEPKNGAQFDGWYYNDNLLTHSLTHTITAAANSVYTARFTAEPGYTWFEESFNYSTGDLNKEELPLLYTSFTEDQFQIVEENGNKYLQAETLAKFALDCAVVEKQVTFDFWYDKDFYWYGGIYVKLLDDPASLAEQYISINPSFESNNLYISSNTNPNKNDPVQKIQAHSFAPQTWYSVKTQMLDGMIYMKVWAKGTDEPAAWTMANAVGGAVTSNEDATFNFELTNLDSADVVTVKLDNVVIKTWEELSPKDEMQVTVNCNEAHGTVTGGGRYLENNYVTVKAIPEDNYAFVNWTDAQGNEVSTDAEYSFRVQADTVLTANFRERTPVVLTFMATGMTGPAVIDEENKLINVTFAADIDLTKVRPYFYVEDDNGTGKKSYELMDLSGEKTVDLVGGWKVKAQQNSVMKMLYVDPVNGSDSNDGSSIANAFKTIQAAQAAVRAITSWTGDVFINLVDGEYLLTDTLTFTDADSAENGCAVIYRSLSGDASKVKITSGQKITGWTDSDNDGIWTASAEGIPYSRDLFVNGQKATIARDTTNIYSQLTIDRSNSMYTVTDEVLNKIGTDNQDNVEFVYEVRWTYSIIPVDHVDGNKVYMMHEPFQAGLAKPGVSIAEGDTVAYVQNALPLLDEVGEWYFDEDGETIYYKPADGVDPNTLDMVIPGLDQLVTVTGSTGGSTVDGLGFQDLTFEYTSYIDPQTMGKVEIQGNTNVNYHMVPALGGTMINHDSFTTTPAGVEISYANGLRVAGCTFHHFSNSALELSIGVKAASVSGNVFTDVGANGIQIGGFSVRDAQPYASSAYNNGTRVDGLSPDPWRVTEQILVFANDIENIGVSFRGSVGIFVGYVQDITIAHNRLHALPYSGISIGWGWGYWDPDGRPIPASYIDFETPTIQNRYVVENNYISSVMQRLNDGGAIYTLGLMPGSKINGNYCTDCAHPYGSIYLDEGAGGFAEIERNIITNDSYSYFYHVVDTYRNLAAESLAVQKDNFFKNDSPGDPLYDAIKANAGLIEAPYTLKDLSVDDPIVPDDEPTEDEIAAAAVEAMIEAIGVVTIDDAEAIAEARTAYNALSDDAKALVENLAVLEAAEAALEALQKPVRPSLPVHPPVSVPSKPVVTVKLPFVDVPASAWYYDEVKMAWEAGLIDGMTATTYEPESTLTVAQAIKLAAALHQMENLGKVTLTNGTGDWYSTYVTYAIANGIIEEAYADYTWAQMNAPATRAEFVHIFYGAKEAYAEKNTVADNAIPDVKVGDKYADEIYTFYRAGILTGNDAAGTFAPASSIKRSEVAAILIRMFDTSARQSVTLN